MRIRNVLLATILLGLSAGGASAVPIQYHVAFGAGNFTSSPAGTEPPLLVTGSFDIDLDIGTNVPADTTAGLHNTAISASNTLGGNPFPFQIDSPWSFTYDKTNDILVIGGSSNGSGTIHYSGPTENDFYLQIHAFSSASPLMWQLGFAQTRLPDTQFYNPQGGSPADGFIFVTAGGPVATTPLPAGLPLFLTALGAIGLGAWARKRGGMPGAVPA